MNPVDPRQIIRSLGELHLLVPEQVNSLLAEQWESTVPYEDLLVLLHSRGLLTTFQSRYCRTNHPKSLVIDRYVVLDLLGEGGMGQVFKARDWRLDQLVALKTIRPDRVSSQAVLQRFQREIRAVARLDHPNIVRAIDAGEHEGGFFFAMEFVAGTNLSDWVRSNGPMPIGDAWHAVRQAALGLQHAHEQGIVHRDIKPSNLLRTTDGTVKILDLGLARLTGPNPDSQDRADLTATGSPIGTPDFMAPEQIKDSSSVDGRADIYSLGCTLFYLLCGRPPFDKPTPLERLFQHLQEPPPPIRSLRPDTPEPLARLLHRMLAKSPSDRPESTWHLLVELDAVRAAHRAVPIAEAVGDSVCATETFADLYPRTVDSLPPPPKKAGKLRPLLIAGGITLLLFFAGLFLLRSERRTPFAEAEPNPGEASSKSPAQPDIWKQFQARLANPTEDKEKLRIDLLAAFRAADSTATATRIAGLLRQAPGPLHELLAVWTDPKSGLEVVFRADRDVDRHWGKILAIAAPPKGDWIATAGEDEVIRIRDRVNLKQKKVLERQGEPIRELTVSPNGAFLASSGYFAERATRLWKMPEGELLRTFDEWQVSAAFSTDSKRIALGSYSSIQVWDVDPLRLVRRIDVENDSMNWVVALAWVDADRFLSGSNDGVIRLWNAQTGKLLGEYREHTGPIRQILVHPDAKRIISASNLESGFRVWSIEDFGKGERLDFSPLQATTFEIAPAGDRLVAVLNNRAFVLVDLSGSPKELRRLPQSFGKPTRIRFLEDQADRFLAVYADASIRRHDLATLQVTNIYTKPFLRVERIALSDDQRCFLTGNTESGWSKRPLTDKESEPLLNADGPYIDSWLMSDARTIALIRPDKCVELVDSVAGKLLSRRHLDVQGAVSITPDGKLIGCVQQREDRVVLQLFDGISGEEKSHWALDHESAERFWLTNDGRFAITMTNSGTVHLWDTQSGKEVWNTPDFDAELCSALFLADQRRLAVALSDRRIRIVDFSAKAVIQELVGLSRKPHLLAASADGKVLAATARDGMMYIWDLQTGKVIHSYRFPGPVQSMSFAMDQRHLLVAGGDGSLWILRTANP